MEPALEPLYSMTTLQRNPTLVKQQAKDNLVRITEQGSGAFVFCSEEVFAKRIAQEREDAAYEARIAEAVGRGIADIEEGRYTTSVEEALRNAAKLRLADE